MRLSRPNYDKPHRCPGWAGGGWGSARESRCYNGSVRVDKLDWVQPRDGDEATCTCGDRIVNFAGGQLWYAPERMGPTPGTWCEPTTPGYLQGHRPPRVLKYPTVSKWRFGRCIGTKENSYSDEEGKRGCGVVTWPWALRFLDPSWYRIYYWRLVTWRR